MPAARSSWSSASARERGGGRSLRLLGGVACCSWVLEAADLEGEAAGDTSEHCEWRRTTPASLSSRSSRRRAPIIDVTTLSFATATEERARAAACSGGHDGVPAMLEVWTELRFPANLAERTKCSTK
eukprot:5007874-Prymnesium_polylepis.1